MNNLPLTRAIWESGFRAGLDNGRENAIARMNGKENEVTEDAEEAWVDYVEWKLEGTPELDPEDPKSWNSIP